MPPPPLPGSRLLFGLASLVTLCAGVVLEESGNELANRLGINGVIFGATVLATATALPEISSGIAAVRLGDHALAMGDIFGGNAFQVCLFLVADLVAGKPVLPSAAGTSMRGSRALGVALTAIYGFGVIGRPEHTLARLGPDSLLALAPFRPRHRGPLLHPDPRSRGGASRRLPDHEREDGEEHDAACEARGQRKPCRDERLQLRARRVSSAASRCARCRACRAVLPP